jgi:hypothetical protein
MFSSHERVAEVDGVDVGAFAPTFGVLHHRGDSAELLLAAA